MIVLLCSLLISILTGFVTVSLILGGQGCARLGFLFRLCLGTGLGIGISSIVYFLWLVIFGPDIRGVIITELLILLALGVIYFKMISSGNSFVATDNEANSRSSGLALLRIVPAAFIIILISAAASTLMLVLKYPHGLWDAWSIWNVRARFLFRGGEHWTDAFSPNLAHTDYPLYLPSFIARAWSYIGYDTVLVPIVVSILFMIVTVGLIYAALSIYRTRNQGLLAGMLLLGTPVFLTVGVSQYADVPLGFFYLAAITLFLLSEKLPDRSAALLILCGVSAGMAGWIKNEGLLFILSIVLALLITSLVTKNFKKYMRGFAFFAVGLLPVLLVIIYFKTQYAVPNDIVGEQSFQSILQRLFDLPRYVKIIRLCIPGVFNFGNFAFSPVIVLGVYMLLAGVRVKRAEQSGLVTSLLIIIFVAAGYFLIYVITPHDIEWHFRGSFSRLLLQLWPSFILLYFLVVRTPDELLTDEN